MSWPLERDAPGELAAGDVVVWRVAAVTDGTRAAALAPLLSSEERERAERMALPQGRAAFTVTRATLRRLLGRYLAVPPESVPLEYGPMGKPFLPGEPLHFSVTHAADGALIALAHTAVGVDLEQVRERARAERMLERLFAPETGAAIRALPEASRLFAFHAAWTQREAYVKAVGGGMFATPDRLPWVPPGAAVELVSERESGAAWTVVPLVPWEGHCAAAVARGVADRVRLFDAAQLDD